MSFKMLPVGSWRKGDATPWYHVTEDPIVINDENVAEYNLPGRGVLPGEVLVRVCHVTDGGRAMRIFPSEEHLVKTEIPTVSDGKVDPPVEDWATDAEEDAEPKTEEEKQADEDSGAIENFKTADDPTG